MRHKRGDIHPVTGLVFGGYGKSYTNGEWWTTKEIYEGRKARERKAFVEKYKDPDVSAKIKARSKEWRDSSAGKEWISNYESSQHVRDRKNAAEKLKYRESEEWRLRKRERNSEWMKSKEGRAWDAARNRTQERLAYRRARDSERRVTDPVFLLKTRIVNRTTRAIRDKALTSSKTIWEFTGTSPGTLRKFIEDQFCDGMNWGNRSKWHIDHFFPISMAQNDRDLRVFSHFTNLRPLWATDNMKKQATPPTPQEMITRDSFIEKWIKENAQMGGVTTQGMQQ